MGKIFLSLFVLFSVVTVSAQETFTVTASGVVFTPAIINAKIGDKITFSVGASHPVLQVSEASYNSNSNSALSGGFSFPSGSGTVTAAEPGTIYYICTFHISSGMKGKIEISESTNIQKQGSFSEFDIFPNPVVETINVKNPGNSNPIAINIYDISGKKILKSDDYKPQEGNTSLNIKDLRKGIYFISVSYPDKTYTRKFLKL